MDGSGGDRDREREREERREKVSKEAKGRRGRKEGVDKDGLFLTFLLKINSYFKVQDRTVHRVSARTCAPKLPGKHVHTDMRWSWSGAAPIG